MHCLQPYRYRSVGFLLLPSLHFRWGLFMTAHPSSRPSARPFVCPSICPSIHPSIVRPLVRNAQLKIKTSNHLKPLKYKGTIEGWSSAPRCSPAVRDPVFSTFSFIMAVLAHLPFSQERNIIWDWLKRSCDEISAREGGREGGRGAGALEMGRPGRPWTRCKWCRTINGHEIKQKLRRKTEKNL